jgi:DNA polymerase III subunit epsilon
MNIDRPIVFMDIEATGSDATRDRIVEIALIKVQADRSQTTYVQRVNPGVRIPAEVIAVHHITNEDVARSPSFKEIAPQILAFCEGCDFAGFGICRFDIPILKEEFKRCEMPFETDKRCIIDGLMIYHQRERRDLTAAYEFYCQKKLVGAHGAQADAQASMEVLFAQLERYADLPPTVQGLHDYCNKQDDRYVDANRKMIWRDGEAALNFGKYKGELLKDLVRKQRDYVEWMISDGKFPQEFIDICWRALRGEFPKNEKNNGKALEKPADTLL